MWLEGFSGLVLPILMTPVVRFPLALAMTAFLEFNLTADPPLRPSTFAGLGENPLPKLAIVPVAESKEFQPFPGSLSETHVSKSELGI